MSKTLIVHSRSAEESTSIFSQAKLKIKNFKFIMHCFTGSKSFAHKLLDIGSYISASGIITFKKSNDLRETIKSVPLDRLLVETDFRICLLNPLEVIKMNQKISFIQ